MKKCNAGFKSLNIEPSGEISPCCAISPMQNVTLGLSFEDQNFTSSQMWKDIQMLGIQSSFCKYCVAQEQAGAYSLRQIINQNTQDDSVPGLEYLNINLSNICNLKCKTCDESRSFLIGKNSKKRSLSLNSLKKFISDNRQTIKIVSLQGGEPLLYPELLKLVTFIKELNPSIYIALVTNLSFLPDWFEDALKVNLFNRIKFSIDGIGTVAQYIRDGLSWGTFDQNLRRLSGFKNAHLLASITVSSYSIFRINQVFEYLNLLDIQKIDINLVCNPSELDLRNLNLQAKSYLQKMTFNKFDSVLKSRLKLSSEIDESIFPIYTKKMDKERKKDAFATITELSQFYK